MYLKGVAPLPPNMVNISYPQNLFLALHLIQILRGGWSIWILARDILIYLDKAVPKVAESYRYKLKCWLSNILCLIFLTLPI